MTMKRRSRPRRGSSRGLRTTWAQFGVEFALTAPTGPIVFADLTPEPMISELSTIGQAKLLRMIGHIMYTADVASAADPLHATIGFYVGTHEAIIGGSLLDPQSDLQQAWYYWTFLSATALNSQQIVNFDIRTQRRLRAGYKFIAVANNPLNAQASKISLSLRLLWQIQAG